MPFVPWLARRAERGFKLASQDMLWIFWTYLHFVWVLLIIHVRCLNIFYFGHWFHFWVLKIFFYGLFNSKKNRNRFFAKFQKGLVLRREILRNKIYFAKQIFRWIPSRVMKAIFWIKSIQFRTGARMYKVCKIFARIDFLQKILFRSMPSWDQTQRCGVIFKGTVNEKIKFSR